MKRTISLLILGAFTAVLAFAQTDLQPVAIVRLTKSEPITVKQYRTEVERMEKQAGRPLSANERRQILDVMINNKLLMQAAERDRIIVSDNEVNQQLQQLRNSMAQSLGRQPTEAEFSQAVQKETGLDIPAFREEWRKQMLTQKYMMEKKKDSFSNVKTPTEQEVVNLFTLSKAQFVRPDTVRVSMIEVSFADATAKVKAREIADRLVREIGTNPANFDAAVLKGQTPNAGYQAGDLGYLPRNLEARQMVGAEFMDTAFSLKQGEVSRLLEGRSSFQIIKVTETYGQKNLELDDIFQLGTRMTVRDYLGNALLQEAQQALIEKVTQELVAELRSGAPYQIIESNLNW